MSYDEPEYGQIITESIDDLYNPLQEINRKLEKLIELLEVLVEKDRREVRE